MDIKGITPFVEAFEGFCFASILSLFEFTRGLPAFIGLFVWFGDIFWPGPELPRIDIDCDFRRLELMLKLFVCCAFWATFAKGASLAFVGL